MKNNHRFVSYLVLLTFLSGVGAFSISAAAQDSDMPEQPPVAAAPDIAAPPAVHTGPLTVTDVIIDKTDKNAVVARDQAIIEAQRVAFETVAEKSMSPDGFKAYKVPDNKTIATMVADFEIKNEQIAGNRYVANFTVRFLPDINSYIKIPESLGRVIVAAPPAPVAATAPAAAAGAKTEITATSSATPKTLVAPDAAAAPSTPRVVLILPYYEDSAGHKVLWEDPNPWRDAWQEAGSSTPTPTLSISVPLGDLTDVSSGNTDAVWAGDYSTIEKSRVNYNATEVALVVAHSAKVLGINSGRVGSGGIDLYIYKDGKMAREKSIGGKFGGLASYKKAITKMISVLKTPVPYDTAADKAATPVAAATDATAAAPASMAGESTTPAPASAEDAAVPPESPKPMAESEPAAAPGRVAIEATMSFGNYAQWMDVQKRLASLSPPVDIEISSITKDQAQFTMAYEGGNLTAFKSVLAGKGISLDRPTVEVDEAVLGSAKPTQKTVYELKLQN